MRRLRYLIALLAACSLTSCGRPVATPQAIGARTDPPPSSTLAPSQEAATTASPTAEDTTTPSPASSLTPAAMLTPSASPATTATATATATSTPPLPPLQTPAVGEPLALSLDWEFDANGHLTAGCVLGQLVDSRFILTSLGRTVYALSRAGRVEWRYRTEGPVYTVAVLDDSRIAVGDDAGYVSLLSGDGRLVWRHDLGSRVTALQGSGQGRLLVGGWDERLTLLSTDDDVGRVIWQKELDGPISDVGSRPDAALVTTLDGTIWAFGAGGAELWHRDLGTTICSLETVETAEMVLTLLSMQDGRLIALGQAGQPIWLQSLGPTAQGCPVVAVSDQMLADDLAIVAGTGGTAPVLALLSATGEQLWRLAVPEQVGAVTLHDIDGDHEAEILAGLADGQIKAMDALGRERGSAHAGLAVWGFVPDDGLGVVALADVVAWRLVAADGPSGSSWLRPPHVLLAPPQPLPQSAQRQEAPEAGPAEGRATDEAILVFLGDVSLGRTMEMQMARFGTAYPWSGLAPLLTQADLTVANLEGVLTTQGKPLDKSYLIRAHPRWAQTLAEAGIDLVSVANNHVLDFGYAGLDETLNTLSGLGISAVGVGSSHEIARRPALASVNGIRVAMLAYAASRWDGSVDVPATDRLAWAYPEAVQADVSAVRDRADVVVVMLHAGTEYDAGPSPDQVKVARAAVDAGADLVVGHHPHVTQTVEQYGQGLIVYSLGDALFDIPRQAAMRGHLLRVHITVKGITQAELWPFWIENAVCPRLLDDGQGEPRMIIVLP